MTRQPVIVIGGFGPGLGTGVASVFDQAGYQVVTLSRRGASYPGALNLACDLTNRDQVRDAIAKTIAEYGQIDVFVHNVFALHVGGFLDTGAETFEQVWRGVTLSAVNTSQEILPHMLKAGAGTILFSGATAAIKGGGRFSAFASAKFALRGLAQSLAREFQPQGIHVAHVILDGLMNGTHTVDRFGGTEDSALNPAEVATQYLNLVQQPKSCWSQEMDLRHHMEGF